MSGETIEVGYYDFLLLYVNYLIHRIANLYISPKTLNGRYIILYKAARAIVVVEVRGSGVLAIRIYGGDEV